MGYISGVGSATSTPVAGESTSLTVRHDEKGRVDEVIAHNCDVHLEQMHSGSWLLILSRGDEHAHVVLGSKRRVRVIVNDWGLGRVT